MPALSDRQTLGQVLSCFGARLVCEISHPNVIAVFRLAIAEAVQAPKVAHTLNSIGRRGQPRSLAKNHVGSTFGRTAQRTSC
jgi:hypothetical protein